MTLQIVWNPVQLLSFTRQVQEFEGSAGGGNSPVRCLKTANVREEEDL